MCLNHAACRAILGTGDALGEAELAFDLSLGEWLGLNVEAGWNVFWLVFFTRLALGAAVGIDEVLLSFRRNSPRSAASNEARTLRRGNNVVTFLNAILVVLFVVLTPLMFR
jgi:hypothetical protein